MVDRRRLELSRVPPPRNSISFLLIFSSICLTGFDLVVRHCLSGTLAEIVEQLEPTLLLKLARENWIYAVDTD